MMRGGGGGSGVKTSIIRQKIFLINIIICFLATFLRYVCKYLFLYIF